MAQSEMVKPKAPSQLELPTAEELQEDQALAERHELGVVAQKPGEMLRRAEERIQTLNMVWRAGIAATLPEDWTLNMDGDGRVIGAIRASGASRLRRAWGISIFNIRNAQGQTTNEVTLLRQPQGWVAEIYGDAYCGLTRERFEGLRGCRKSWEQFIGREVTEGSPDLEDLKQAARTNLDKRAVSILGGVAAVPESVLKECGIKTELCYRGHGYGSAKGRRSQAVAEEGIGAHVDELEAEVIRRVGGDLSAKRQLVREITANPDGKDAQGKPKPFAGFDDLKRLTQKWQIDKAWERLVAHSIFGGPRPARKEA